MSEPSEQMRRFGERLREARAATALNQEEFGRLGGVKKNSQLLYETGKTPPTVEYLYALAASGIDIGYILTGRRADVGLASDEQQMLEMAGELSARELQGVLSLIAALTGRMLRSTERHRPTATPAVHGARQEYRSEEG